MTCSPPPSSAVDFSRPRGHSGAILSPQEEVQALRSGVHSFRARPAANCFDNACAETFFRSLKVQVIYGNRYPIRESVRQEVVEYVETSYSATRPHSFLGYLSRSQFGMSAVA